MKATFTTTEDNGEAVLENFPQLRLITKNNQVLFFQAELTKATEADRLIEKASKKAIQLELHKIGGSK